MPQIFAYLGTILRTVRNSSMLQHIKSPWSGDHPLHQCPVIIYIESLKYIYAPWPMAHNTGTHNSGGSYCQPREEQPHTKV